MRNFAYFLAGFLVICLIGLTTACSMPLRKPEPYEQRPAQKQAHRDKTEWQQIEDYVDARKRESATWWRCLERNRADEC